MTFDDLTQGLSAAVDTAEIKVTVSGRDGVLQDVKASDFVMSVGLDGLTAGNHSVKLDVTSNKDLNDIKVSPEKIQITISTE